MGIKEKGLIKELKNNGFSYKDVDKIYAKQSLEPVEVEIILKWLPELYKEHVGTGDSAVRSLMAAKRAFDPSLLINLFVTIGGRVLFSFLYKIRNRSFIETRLPFFSILKKQGLPS